MRTHGQSHVCTIMAPVTLQHMLTLTTMTNTSAEAMISCPFAEGSRIVNNEFLLNLGRPGPVPDESLPAGGTEIRMRERLCVKGSNKRGRDWRRGAAGQAGQQTERRKGKRSERRREGST